MHLHTDVLRPLENRIAPFNLTRFSKSSQWKAVARETEEERAYIANREDDVEDRV